MTVYLAEKTLAEIERVIKADQGNSYRFYLEQVIPHIGDAYRQDTDPFRSHMGASGIGAECARDIWYSFRWATMNHFDGQLLRLFNRGHLEEARFIAMLLCIGVRVYQQDEKGDQFRISDAGGHFGGSGDGKLYNLPDLPDAEVLGEFKTLSTKYAPKLEANGCEDEKFQHYVQMQVYMKKMGIGIALYMSVDKNNDKLYGELVPLNSEVADEFIQRGVTLTFAMEPPAQISKSPGYYKCRFCNHKPVCKLDAVPVRSCRSCISAVPMPDGTWSCSDTGSPMQGTIDKSIQLIACDRYTRAF